MKRNADEVVVRVDGNGDHASALAANGAPRYNALQADSPAMYIFRERETTSTHLESTDQQTGLCDETHDAIWECLSPDATSDLKHDKEGGSRTTHEAMEGIAVATTDPVNNSCLVGSLLHRPEKEHRHRSLDLDIHITEPNLLKLQDRTCKPLSDHLVERDFSLRPKSPRTDLSARRPVRPVLSKDFLKQGTGTSPGRLRPDFPSFAANEHRGAAAAHLQTVDIPSSQSSNHGEEAKCEKGRDSISKEVEGSRESISKEVGTEGIEFVTRKSNCDSENNRSFKLSGDLLPNRLSSHKLAQTKSKSRLVEPPSPLGTRRSTRISIPREGTRSATPSARILKTVAEDEEEDDPLNDIDLSDKFKRGNWNWVTLLQWAAFFIITTGLVCSLTVPALEHHLIWGLQLWKWILLILVVFCGRLVSGWLIRVIVFAFERNFLFRKRVLYFVYGLRKGVQNCLWLGLALLAWKLMFDPKVERSTKNHKALSVITKLLECFLLGAGIWLLKILLVKVFASSFHVSTFFDRIQESLFDQHVLETLSGPPLLEMGAIFNPEGDPIGKSEAQVKNATFTRNGLVGTAEKSQRKGDTKVGNEVKETQPISVDQLHKLNPQNISAWNMKRLINLVKYPAIPTLAQSIDESVSYEEDPQDIEISSERQAKAAAKRIFKNVAKPNSSSIEEEDLMRFVRPEEAGKVLLSFEGAKETGKITKKSLKNWVVSVYQKRRSLALSLNDTKTAVDELHRVISVVVAIIIIILWLLILGIATTHVLLFITSQFLLVGFMFGNTLKQVFEAIVFLFIVHPYDVGDRCVIDGVQMVVEEMNILSTVFLRYDNEKIYYPNAVLATKAIGNLYRSPDMSDAIDFSVHISTPIEKIAALKDKIARYIECKPTHWNPKYSVVVKEIEDLNRMRMTIVMLHTMNFQNAGERWARRSDLLLELKKCFEELGIEYRLLPQEVHLRYITPP